MQNYYLDTIEGPEIMNQTSSSNHYEYPSTPTVHPGFILGLLNVSVIQDNLEIRSTTSWKPLENSSVKAAFLYQHVER